MIQYKSRLGKRWQNAIGAYDRETQTLTVTSELPDYVLRGDVIWLIGRTECIQRRIENAGRGWRVWIAARPVVVEGCIDA